MEYQYQNYIECLKKRGSVPGLEQIRMLLDELGHPERRLRVIHVAGTNGKGSVIAYLSSILKEAGYRVGKYISPTIHSYEERFQIDGEEITHPCLEHCFRTIWEAMCKMEKRGEKGATLFEAETALAFLWFAEQKVDFALIETGMGGRLDATNVVEKPFLTVLSSISYDHKQFLGDTLEAIAKEKAGIIKKGVPVVYGENPPEVCQIIKQEADIKESSCICAELYEVAEEGRDGSTFIWKKQHYHTNLPGRHQIANAALALEAVHALESYCGLHIENMEEVLKHGVEHARWPGRLELLQRNPYVYRDGAHNPDGARKLSQFLEKHFTNNRIIYIMGVLRDKEYKEMLKELLPLSETFYVFCPPNERGLPAEILAGEIRRAGKTAKAFDGVRQALSDALYHAGPEDVLVVCGSLSFMEDMECK